MRRYISLLIVGLLASLCLCAQDFGTQIPNSNFEADWKSYSGSKQSGSEPFGWHSGMSANGSKANYMKSQIDKSSNVRPGSTGAYSVKIKCREINIVLATIKANGTLTNGRMNAGAVSADDDDNHVFTDRSTEEFHTEINVVPDSLTIWVAFYAESSGHKACVRAAVHGDYNHIFYGDGSAKKSEEVAAAITTFKRTSSSSGTLVWNRLSIPFSTENCTSTDPRYILMNCTTNETPGSGNGDDYLMVDDAVLIYNPSLTTGTLTQTYYEGAVESQIPIEVPFTLTGSMSVSNLNVDANQVIAQLSDANGSFDNPIELGRVTTKESGVVTANIPASVKDGTYKVRVVSTNYPMTAEPSTSEITVRRYYDIAYNDVDATIGTLTGAGHYYVDETKSVTVSASVNSKEYEFAYWFENESVVSVEPTYTFAVEKSRNLQAIFKKQCYVTITAGEGGSVSTESGYFPEGQGLIITATPNDGYKFINWTNGKDVVSTNATYTFSVSENVSLTANFAKAVTIQASVNIDGVGAISGTGNYVIENGETVEVTLFVVSNDEEKYKFLNWTENGEVVSTSASYTFTTSDDRTLVANFVGQVSINASVLNDGGSITGAGIYALGSDVSLMAFPDDDFQFVGWYEADTLFSKLTTIQFEASGERTFVAKFGKTYLVTLLSNIVGAGTLSGAGNYEAESQVTISAEANEGFVFTNWTIQNEEVSTEASYTFTADSSVTVVANFAEINKYEVSVSIEPNASGVITGQGIYYENKHVTLTATPNNGYDFVNWTENGVEISTEPNIDFTITANRSLVANFKANFTGYTVALSVVEGGTVSGAGLYMENQEVTVVATPALKYSFISWTKNGEVVSTDASYTFVITDDISLEANFERFYSKYQINVTVADELQGTIVGESKKYTEEDDVTFVAVPNDGYRFLQWTENGEIVSTDAEYTFVCNQKRNLVAEFKKVYKVSLDEVVGGSVKGFGTGIFDENTSVTLAFVLDENYRFISWKDADKDSVVSTNVVYSFIASADCHLAIEVKEKGKLCTISVQTGGTVSGLRNGQYEAGETVTLVASASEGYLFEGWVQNGEIISTETMLSFVVSDDANIYAKFVAEPQPVEVSVSVNDDTFGSVIGAGSYKEGEEVMLIATPANGYEFVGWKKDGKLLSNLTTLYYIVVEDCTIEAEFRFIEKAAIESVDNASIQVYPNPVSTTLHIVSNEIIESVALVSAQGRVVYKNNVDAEECSIDVQQFTKGLYYVTIESNGSKQQVIPVVLK